MVSREFGRPGLRLRGNALKNLSRNKKRPLLIPAAFFRRRGGRARLAARLLKSPLVCAALLLLLAPLLFLTPLARTQSSIAYRNPILFADYSDPDAIRDGSHYYLIASTFHFVPGIPILESTDLVHWTILGHVVRRLEMDPRYSMTGGNRYGMGVWAPSIRKHNGLFYVYFPTPTEGIFVSTAPKITGPWSAPEAVMAQAGLEDPCPFWDDDGKAYLIHSKKGAGPLILHRMSADGKHLLDAGKVIVDDPHELPTLEGPKLYKRNGWYYIFAPFGGVGIGKQAVLRSHSIYGPYEHRVVLAQGDTKINGPHQGAYVETPEGEGWFLHFQSRGAHGRIVHLEPVTWKDDWPAVGKDPEEIPTGEPVPSGVIHVAAKAAADAQQKARPQTIRPQTSDEFSESELGTQWEWNHNPDDARWSLTARRGFLRLIPAQAENLLDARNTLTQCMQDNAFEFTARLDLSALSSGTHAGLAMFEQDASGIEIVQAGAQTGAQANKERRLEYFHLPVAGGVSGPGASGSAVSGPLAPHTIVQLRVRVEGDEARYFFSLDDGRSFQPLGPATPIRFSWWKGSRPSLFAYTTQDAGAGAESAAGAVDFDWAHYEPLGENPW
jgi:beta-xylosidase